MVYKTDLSFTRSSWKVSIYRYRLRADIFHVPFYFVIVSSIIAHTNQRAVVKLQ